MNHGFRAGWGLGSSDLVLKNAQKIMLHSEESMLILKKHILYCTFLCTEILPTTFNQLIFSLFFFIQIL
jgi:hypothetical protein